MIYQWYINCKCKKVDDRLYIDRGISRNLGICRFIKAVIKKPVDKNIETIKILE